MIFVAMEKLSMLTWKTFFFFSREDAQEIFTYTNSSWAPGSSTDSTRHFWSSLSHYHLISSAAHQGLQRKRTAHEEH